jgi:hypothetical protein
VTRVLAVVSCWTGILESAQRTKDRTTYPSEEIDNQVSSNFLLSKSLGVLACEYNAAEQVLAYCAVTLLVVFFED